MTSDNTIDRTQNSFLYKNLANIASLVGVLPLLLLYVENGYHYLIPLILFNNVMDDLDGILAAKLNIRSRFGADLDNVCDAVAHVALSLAVGAHYGGIVLSVSVVAAGAIILRATSRLNPEGTSGGSPTNELMRHLLFILLLSSVFGIDAEPLLISVFLLNTVSMSVPFKMTAMIRSQAKTAILVVLVNLALISAWLFPSTTAFIALPFLLTYLYALLMGGVRWISSYSSPTSV